MNAAYKKIKVDRINYGGTLAAECLIGGWRTGALFWRHSRRPRIWKSRVFLYKGVVHPSNQTPSSPADVDADTAVTPLPMRPCRAFKSSIAAARRRFFSASICWFFFACARTGGKVLACVQ
jgi:hypothetical protein